MFKDMDGVYEHTVDLWNRIVLRSFVVMVVLLGLVLVFSSLLLNFFHQFDQRTYFSVYFDTFYYRYAIDLPCLAGAVATLSAMAWLCIQVFRQKWPKTYLVNVAFYFGLFFIFLFLLVNLDFGNFQ